MPNTDPIRDRSARIRQALLEKGYRVLNVITPKAGQSHSGEFILYAKGSRTVLMEIFADGGCEVWTPITESISIEETINALPN
jgi:hypothetical protein